MKKIKKIIKNYVNDIKKLDTFQKVLYFVILSILVVGFVLTFEYSIWILPLVILVALVVIVLMNNKFLKSTNGNGIIYGNRGSGKGVLLQKKINSQKKPYFCNVPYSNKTLDLNMLEYFNSISPNTIENTINGDIKTVKKIEKYENRNVFIDDINIYLPNFEDILLKKKYPGLPLVLAINRHLYNHYTIILTQAADRPYKVVRELQTDFSVKALKTFGFGYIWNAIPILRNLVITKYRYYEEIKAREEGVLPFNGKAVINETLKHAYLTSGQATKETFEAKYGKVFHGFVIQLKKSISYDTRYFHEKFYGYKAPN